MKPLEPVDWASFRKRMAAVARAADKAANPPSERARQILEDRARALAAPLPHQPLASENCDVVIFQLSDDRYCIETRCVAEVVPLQKITALPRTPDFVVGLINLRGELLPVFDLRRLFGLTTNAATTPSHVIVVDEHRNKFGITVDSLPQAGSISFNKLTTIPDEQATGAHSWLIGATRDAVIVIDGDTFVADQAFFLE